MDIVELILCFILLIILVIINIILLKLKEIINKK